jgi:hypothetical protein
MAVASGDRVKISPDFEQTVGKPRGRMCLRQSSKYHLLQAQLHPLGAFSRVVIFAWQALGDCDDQFARGSTITLSAELVINR